VGLKSDIFGSLAGGVLLDLTTTNVSTESFSLRSGGERRVKIVMYWEFIVQNIVCGIYKGEVNKTLRGIRA